MVTDGREALEANRSFAVCNADDIYGEVAMGMLAGQLAAADDEHTMIGYRLASTVATDDPVTRGICEVDPNGHLVALTERRKVTSQVDGGSFRAEDGVEPTMLSADLPTSVNLWGFQPAIWDVFETAMDASGLDEDALIAELAAGGELPGVEVLLPEVVANMVAGGIGLPVRVLTTDAKLVGVTHAADLPVVSAELARQVAWGIRPAGIFADVDWAGTRTVTGLALKGTGSLN
ncbi:MAG TPA: hypothetical protein VFC03_00850 [Acidimicrobiales bacterium]|nr:hypothetical protein [Acidimicrobiales bacterium]